MNVWIIKLAVTTAMGTAHWDFGVRASSLDNARKRAVKELHSRVKETDVLSITTTGQVLNILEGE